VSAKRDKVSDWPDSARGKSDPLEVGVWGSLGIFGFGVTLLRKRLINFISRDQDFLFSLSRFERRNHG
jgi:hypothetical protein